MSFLKSNKFLFMFLFLLGSIAVQAQGSSVEKEVKGVPVMQFDNRVHDFGIVSKGETVTHIYKFINAGAVPMTIELVSGCDCTDIEWPEGETFQPGEGGEIKASFVSEREEEKGQLEKTIDIYLENVNPETGYQIVEELKYNVILLDN